MCILYVVYVYVYVYVYVDVYMYVHALVHAYVCTSVCIRHARTDLYARITIHKHKESSNFLVHPGMFQRVRIRLLKLQR